MWPEFAREWATFAHTWSTQRQRWPNRSKLSGASQADNFAPNWTGSCRVWATSLNVGLIPTTGRRICDATARPGIGESRCRGFRPPIGVCGVVLRPVRIGIGEEVVRCWGSDFGRGRNTNMVKCRPSSEILAADWSMSCQCWQTSFCTQVGHCRTRTGSVLGNMARNDPESVRIARHGSASTRAEWIRDRPDSRVMFGQVWDESRLQEQMFDNCWGRRSSRDAKLRLRLLVEPQDVRRYAFFSIWDPFGVDPVGSVWGRSGVDPGSIWARSEVDLLSIPGRFRVGGGRRRVCPRRSL